MARVPNFVGRPTVTAVKSGFWSDPATWGGRVPGDGDVVAIPAGKDVTYDVVSDARLKAVGVLDGGDLEFSAGVPTRLRVTTLMVLEGGVLYVDTDAGVATEIIVNDEPIDTAADPEQWGHGLLCWGKVTATGGHRTPFARLATEPRAGDTAISLAEPVTGWQAGDRIIVADSHQHYGEVVESQTERATIAAVSADGLSVTLDAPLAFDHLGARDPDGKLTFLPHVGNLTRNVVVRSENANGVRGHCVFTGRADVDIEGVQFGGLGRTRFDLLDDTVRDGGGNVAHVGTNQRGRYPVHFHHCLGPLRSEGARLLQDMLGTPRQFRLSGCSVFCPIDPMPFRWGVVVHHSHFGEVSNNVVFNWMGAGIVAGEAGNETGNVVSGNFVARVVGNNSVPDDLGLTQMGRDGGGVWSLSFDNVVTDNVVSDSSTAYQFFGLGNRTVRVPLFPGADTMTAGQYKEVLAGLVPVREFARNEGYGGHTKTAVGFWWLGTGGDKFNTPADMPESVIKDFRGWHAYQNVFLNYNTNRLTIDGLVARGDVGLLRKQASGVTAVSGGGDYVLQRFLVVNSDIQGFVCGFMPSSVGEKNEFRDTYVRNYCEMYVVPPWWLLEPGRMTMPRVMTFNGVKRGKLDVGDLTDWWGVGGLVVMNGKKRGDSTNLVALTKVLILNEDGVPGKNYRVYFNEAAADAVLPQSSPKESGLWVTGSPEPGLTNAEAWDRYKVAFGGAVAPATCVTRPDVYGLVEELPEAGQ
jgi:hypothetical protein